jgi:hypothetical protein
MSLIHSEPNLFHIFKSCHAWLFKRLFSNRLHMQDAFFSVEEAMAEETKVEVTGIEAQEGPCSLYILTLIQKSLAKCFMPDYLIGLGREWSDLGLEGLLSKHRKPPVSLYLLMFHYNLRSLKMMDGMRLSTRQSPNIMSGPTCLCLLLRRLTPFPKLPLTIRQCNPPMLARY